MKTLDIKGTIESLKAQAPEHGTYIQACDLTAKTKVQTELDLVPHVYENGDTGLKVQRLTIVMEFDQVFPLQPDQDFAETIADGALEQIAEHYLGLIEHSQDELED